MGGDMPPLVGDAPLLEPSEYAMWYEEFNGEPLPDQK